MPSPPVIPYNPLIHHNYISKYLNWIVWIAHIFVGYLVATGFTQAGAPPGYKSPRNWSTAYIVNVLQQIFLFGTLQVFLLNLTSSNRVLRLYKTIYFPVIYYLAIPMWAGFETIPTILGPSSQYSGGATFVVVVYYLGCAGIVVYHVGDFYLRATTKYDFLGFLLSRLFIVLTIFVIGGIVAVADSRSAVVSYGPVIIAYLVSLFCYNLRHPASIVCLALTTSLYAQSLAWQPAQPDGSFTMFIMERPQVCFATPAEAGWFTCPTCGSHVAKYGMLSNITSNSNNLLERFSIYLTFVQHDLHTPDLSNPKNIDLGYEGVFLPLFHNAW